MFYILKGTLNVINAEDDANGLVKWRDDKGCFPAMKRGSVISDAHHNIDNLRRYGLILEPVVEETPVLTSDPAAKGDQ